MKTLHTPILSTHNPELELFLQHIEKSEILNKGNGYIVAFQDSEPLYIRKYSEFGTEAIKEVEEIICYDGLTGIKCYGGTGLAFFDAGEEISLSSFSKAAVRDWVKKNWKEGILIDWGKVSGVKIEKGAMEATRDSYDWR